MEDHTRIMQRAIAKSMKAKGKADARNNKRMFGTVKLTKKEQKEAQEQWDELCKRNNIPTMKERYGKNAL